MFRIDFPDSLPIYLYNNYKNEYNFKSQFSIIFDKVKDKNSYKGKLVLNAYPHDYNKDYNEKQYISSRLQKNSDNYLDWCIAFDNIYYDDNIIELSKRNFETFDMTKVSFEQYKNKHTDTVTHFYEKLLKLEGMMNTEFGKKIAKKRTDLMKQYLSDLFDEIIEK